MVFNQWPTHGPDPERPLEAFEDGGCLFQLLVSPVSLPLKPLLILDSQASRGVINDLVLLPLYEEGLGALARRRDARHKIVLVRKVPAIVGSGTFAKSVRASGYVAAFLVDSREEALESARSLLRAWQPGVSYAETSTLSPRELRQRIRELRHGATDS